MAARQPPSDDERPLFGFSREWNAAYPQAHAGVLVVHDVVNPPQHAELERQKTALEHQLRERYAGQDRSALQENAVLRAYSRHYHRFNKTYQVQLQVESIALKGKAIPSVSALVEAMFMAEMSTLLLTAGHDLDTTQAPMTLGVARGTESYTVLRGEALNPKAGDMMIVDGQGIISSIICGPDQRTQITAQTRNVVFTVYAPAGISEGAIEQHLGEILRNVQVFAPNARVGLLGVYG